MPDSILKQEISEQPGVIERLLDLETQNVRRFSERLREEIRFILIAARGTSDNAARYAQYLFGAHNRIPVALATPSLFTLYQKPPNLKGGLVIGVSQSGQSPDIVSVLAEARRQGQPTLAVVNDTASPLAANADFIIPMHCGAERAVAATKSYTASLAALALFSCILEGNTDHLGQLQHIPRTIQATLEIAAASLTHTERYRYIDQCAVIGRGYNYSTAFEIALKVKELTSILAEPYSSADFRHGPIAIIHKGYPAMVIAPSGDASESMIELVSDLQRLGSEMLVISDDSSLLRQGQMAFPLPLDIPEWLTPLVAVIPGQMFSLQLTIEKGMDPDHPEGLTKVTETL